MGARRTISVYAQKLTKLEHDINADPSGTLKALRELRKEAQKAGEPETFLQYCTLLIGRCMQRGGRGGEAFKLIATSVRRLDELGAAREAATGYHYLAQLNNSRHDMQMALECCLRGQELARRARDWYLRMNLEIDTAPFHRSCGDNTAGIAAYQRGLEIYEKYVKGKDPRIEGYEEYTEFIIGLNIAIQYFNIGDYDSAKQALDKVAGSEKRVLGGTYEDQYNLEYARICFGAGLINEGFEHADVVTKRLSSDTRRSLHGVSNNYLGLIKDLVRLGEPNKAWQLIELVKPSIEREGNLRVQGILSMILASYYDAVGDKDEALKHYKDYASYVNESERGDAEENKRIILRRIELQKSLRRSQIADAARVRQMDALRQEMAYKAEREEILLNISENTDTFFLLYNPAARSVDFLSKNSARLFGFDAMAAGDPCQELFGWLGVPEEDAEKFCTGELQERVYADYTVINPLTGAEMTIHQALIPTPGKLNIMVLSDITRLTDAIETARRASAAKTDFLSNMSHDIRTPLSAVTGLLDMLEDDIYNPSAARDHLEKIRLSAKHLTELVNDMLDMTRIEAGRMQLNEDTFTMPEFLASVITLIRPQTNMRSQTLRLDAQYVGGDALIGDPLHMRQAFVNILSNAVKFTQPGGAITLGARMTQAREDSVEYQFTFTDNGCGMPPEFLPRLFKPFERAENVERSVQGTGLGMAITKRIVDMMGGQLSVKSALGEGTVFTLLLSFKHGQTDMSEQAAPSVVSPRKQFHGLALMAEDNRINIEVISYILKKLGFAYRVAENGQQALEMFDASALGEYSLILMDVRMPVMNGYEATRRIRALNRPDAESIPIIAMTADAFDEDVRKALEAGMNAHVAKPLDLSELNDVLDRLLP